MSGSLHPMPPPPKEVTDFRFVKLRSLRVFDAKSHASFYPKGVPLNLLAVANNYGILFVATPKVGIRAFRSIDLESLDVDRKSSSTKPSSSSSSVGTLSDCACATLPVSLPVVHVALSCDDRVLCVCVAEVGGTRADLYDVGIFSADRKWKTLGEEEVEKGGEEEEEEVPFLSVRLTSSPSVHVVDVKWSPCAVGTFAVCTSDGQLMAYDVTQQNTLKILGGGVGGGQCSAICWSPKGKQLAAGRKDGSIIHLTADLTTIAKTIPPPPPFEGHTSVATVVWLSTFQMAVGYAINGQLHLVVVDSPKSGAPSFVDFDDVCYGSGFSDDDARPPKYHAVHRPEWGLMVLSSTSAVDVGILCFDGAPGWEQWLVEDSGRAELPLEGNEETHALGMVLGLTSQRPLAAPGASDGAPLISPKPILHLLSSGGVLCSFYALMERSSMKDLTSAPKPLPPSFEARRGTPVKKSIGSLPSRPLAVPVARPTAHFTAFPAPIAAAAASAATPPLPSFAPIDKRAQTAKVPPVTPTAAAAATTVSVTPRKTKKPAHVRHQPQSSAVMRTLVEEIQRFGNEVSAAKMRGASMGSSPAASVGSPSDRDRLATEVDLLLRFASKAKDSVRSTNREVHTLKGAALDCFVAVEEARSLERRSKDGRLLRLARSRSLDPASVRQMRELRGLVRYLEEQLQEAAESLETQWSAFASHSSSAASKLPDMEMIYKMMSSNRELIRGLTHSVARVESVELLPRHAKPLDLSFGSGRGRAAAAIALDKSLSRVFLRMGVTSRTDRNEEEAKASSKLLQSELRRILEKRPVARIRPQDFGTDYVSRLLSPGATWDGCSLSSTEEEEEELVVEKAVEQVEPKAPSKENVSVIQAPVAPQKATPWSTPSTATLISSQKLQEAPVSASAFSFSATKDLPSFPVSSFLKPTTTKPASQSPLSMFSFTATSFTKPEASSSISSSSSLPFQKSIFGGDSVVTKSGFTGFSALSSTSFALPKTMEPSIRAVTNIPQFEEVSPPGSPLEQFHEEEEEEEEEGRVEEEEEEDEDYVVEEEEEEEEEEEQKEEAEQNVIVVSVSDLIAAQNAKVEAPVSPTGRVGGGVTVTPVFDSVAPAAPEPAASSPPPPPPTSLVAPASTTVVAASSFGFPKPVSASTFTFAVPAPSAPSAAPGTPAAAPQPPAAATSPSSMTLFGGATAAGGEGGGGAKLGFGGLSSSASVFGQPATPVFGSTTPSFGATPNVSSSSSIGAGGALFGGGGGGASGFSLGGLGGAPINTNRNIFGGGSGGTIFTTPSASSPPLSIAQAQATGVFGSSGSGLFGSKPVFGSPTGSLGGGGGGVIGASSSSFGSFSGGGVSGGVGQTGFGGFQRPSASPLGSGGGGGGGGVAAGAAAAGASFGAASSGFGSSPTFGGAPTFGGLSPNATRLFGASSTMATSGAGEGAAGGVLGGGSGSGAAPGAGGAFASFSSTEVPTFGSLAASQHSPPPQAPPPAFGAFPSNLTQTPNTSSNAFSAWRS